MARSHPNDIEFIWEVDSEYHRPHSSPEWVPESHDGTVTAESAPEALLAIITGEGAGGLDHAINWDLVDPGRPITIRIRPSVAVVQQGGPSDA